MSTAGLDLFELLDIPRREDSYSSLLRQLLQDSKKLRQRLLARAFTKAPVLVDATVKVELRKKRKNKIPDLILSGQDAKEQCWELFIENKIDAKESDNQTQSYLDGCREREDVGERAAGIYLTLDGDEPKTEMKSSIKTLTHKELGRWVKACLHDFEDPAVQMAAELYVSRACVPRPKVVRRSPIRSLLTPPSGLISRDAGFEALGKAVTDDAASDCWEHRVGKSRGKTLLKFHRRDWVGTEMSGGRFNRANHDVHVELPPFKNGQWRISLHFETHPYQSSKQLQKLKGKGLREFKAMRDCFRDAVHARIDERDGWKKFTKQGDYLQICTCSLEVNAESRVGEVISKLVEALATIGPVVDAALRVAKR